MNEETKYALRETAEKIIEGIPKSYRDGDEEAGRERTVNWLIHVLEEFVERSAVTPAADFESQVSQIPISNEYRADRYDTDDQNVITLWIPGKDGFTWDIRTSRFHEPIVERGEADTKRMDWLESLRAGLWKGITREAIDAAMKEGNEDRNHSEPCV